MFAIKSKFASIHAGNLGFEGIEFLGGLICAFPSFSQALVETLDFCRTGI